MSQIYHIELKSSVSETVNLSDHIIHKLNMTPILDQESMLEILVSVLLADGFAQNKSHERQFTEMNQRHEQVTFDLDRLEIKVELSEVKEVHTTVVAHHSYDKDFTNQDQALVQAQKKLKANEKLAHENLLEQAEKKQQKLTQKLNDNLAVQQLEFNEIMKQVYAESVKRKARQLGDVMEVSESTENGQYELVIKIEC